MAKKAKKEVKAVLIDAIEKKAKMVEFVPDLKKLYELLNCDCIDITYRYVGGIEYLIVCDDIGLLKPNPIISGVSSKNGEPMLVGNLLFFKAENNNGEFVGLSDEDVENIMSNIQYYAIDHPAEGKISVICACRIEY